MTEYRSFYDEILEKIDLETLLTAPEWIRAPEVERIEQTISVVKRLTANKTPIILDAGCADAAILRFLEVVLPFEYVGADISVVGLRKARKRASHRSNHSFIVCDLNNLPFKGNMFDIVLCTETIEHITTLDRLLTEITRVLKGFVVFTTPCFGAPLLNRLSYNSWADRVNSSIRGMITKKGVRCTLESTAKIADFPTGHVNYFTTPILKRILERYYRIVEFRGVFMHFPFLTKLLQTHQIFVKMHRVLQYKFLSYLPIFIIFLSGNQSIGNWHALAVCKPRNT